MDKHITFYKAKMYLIHKMNIISNKYKNKLRLSTRVRCDLSYSLTPSISYSKKGSKMKLFFLMSRDWTGSWNRRVQDCLRISKAWWLAKREMIVTSESMTSLTLSSSSLCLPVHLPAHWPQGLDFSSSRSHSQMVTFIPRRARPIHDHPPSLLCQGPLPTLLLPWDEMIPSLIPVLSLILY